VDLGEPDRTPWIVTNPIYARATLAKSYASVFAPGVPHIPIAASQRPEAWTPEHASGATARATPGATAASPPVEFRWALGTGAEQYAAIRLEAPADLARADRLFLRASADRPMRVWVQLRSPADGGRRWGRSVRLLPVPPATPHELPLDALSPLDGQRGPVPLADITAILLVIDTVHNRPGDSGLVRLDGLELTLAP
jgi:hypothetical protein